MDHIYLRKGGAKAGGGGEGEGKGRIDFFCQGGCVGEGVQNKFEQKSRGGGVKGNY